MEMTGSIALLMVYSIDCLEAFSAIGVFLGSIDLNLAFLKEAEGLLRYRLSFFCFSFASIGC
jgi:hypothetical protein